MADKREGPRFAVAFDEVAWEREVGRLGTGSRARVAAEAARRVLERDGVRRDQLARCKPRASDGTELGGLVKVRLPLDRPASEAPFGLVLEPFMGADERLGLRVIAFGERHPQRPATRSVYERAHDRRHGRWPTPDSGSAPQDAS